MSCDVIVVGGGLIGGSIAWRLAQRGLKVTVLEAGDFGGQASHAGAGMLAPGGEFTRDVPALRLGLRSLSMYQSYVDELQDASGIRDIDYRRSGALEVAFNEGEWLALRAKGKIQAKLGIASETLPVSECATLVPGLAVASLAGALFYPHDAQVDPRTLLPAVRIAADRGGVTIVERTPVRSISLREHGVEAKTMQGTFCAASAVLAAGAWSAALESTEALPASYSVKGQLIGYQLRPGVLRPILRRGHVYLLQRSSGIIVAGASTEAGVYNRVADASVTNNLTREAALLWPELTRHQRVAAWAGMRPATTADSPCIGRWRDSPLWLAFGHYRNGILLAPATAEAIADSITSNREREQACSSGKP